MASAEELERCVKRLPRRCGVYLFRGRRGTVLYIGKAIDLRARVRQYLSGHDTRTKIPFLLAQTRDVDFVVTENETEALLLENSLIAQHQPRYNARLRDDKSFPFLRLNRKHAWPRYEVVRRPRDDEQRYFGPYTSARRARSTLEFMKRAFPLRTCTDQVLRSRRRPCILYQMGRCVAPCVDGKTSPEAYSAIVAASVLFLEGKSLALKRALESEMWAATEREAFEEAARLRDLIRDIESTVGAQPVSETLRGDRDIWNLWRAPGREHGVALVLPMRDGRLLEPFSFSFALTVGEDAELLSSWLYTWYAGDSHVPSEILIPVDLVDHTALEGILRARRGGRVRLMVPQRGDRVRLLTMAKENARERAMRNPRGQASDGRSAAGLEQLAGHLGLPTAPYRIECFDNSNLQGAQPVASQVVFIEGQPAKAAYRTYRIASVTGIDDYASMREVIGRRFRRAATEGIFPDLVVVDGGRGQLSAAKQALEALGLDDQPIVGLAKPRTERARGEDDAVDKIILYDTPEALHLPPNDPALNLLQAIRDESHRFALAFHRKLRSRATFTSVLDAIPGVGRGRRRALLRHFSSVAAIRSASDSEIAAVPGIGEALAARIGASLRGDSPGDLGRGDD